MAVSPAQPVIRFGLFELDPQTGQLSRQGIKLRLPQQPVQLLAVLLERPGEVFSREELQRRLWPSDVFVDFDHGLNKSIQKLREVLGDSAASPRYIETIPRVGYRFIAPVHTENGNHAIVPELPPKTERPPILLLPPRPPPAIHRNWLLPALISIAGLALLAALYLELRPHPTISSYTQLTDVTDSAGTPALSSDGKILAFIRSPSNFVSDASIYVKMLPNGEVRRVTDDSRSKYNLAFSPDNSQLAYTVMEDNGFSTYVVSVFGGDPHLLIKNAAGLTWLDQDHVLFSRLHSGLHLGVVTGLPNGQNVREVYFPPHERAMVHYAYASPDRKSALIVLMNGDGDWDQCQLISFPNGGTPEPVGPAGGCTAAAWSPDGAWMYFIAFVNGQSHLWRQSFPRGKPQQLTFGPTEESWIAVDPDGRSVVTAMGVHGSVLFVHDSSGDRALSSEGEITGYPSPPVFTADDKFLYYLMRHSSTQSGAELWRSSISDGKSEPVLTGVSIDTFDISADARQVVYATTGRDGVSQVWVAPLDRNVAPRQLTNHNEHLPHFGPHGDILFIANDGHNNYLERLEANNLRRSRVVPYPVDEILTTSPQRHWATAVMIDAHTQPPIPRLVAIPLEGGPPISLCLAYCAAVLGFERKVSLPPAAAGFPESRHQPGHTTRPQRRAARLAAARHQVH